MSKKDAAVYREAARSIERGEEYFCCYAITRIQTGGTYPPSGLSNKFVSAYGKRNRPMFGWYGIPYGDAGTENQNARVIALCFAAAMAEAGDL